MATTSLSNTFRRDILNGVIDLSADDIRMALYNGSGHSQTTTQYSVTNEASGTGYTAGGNLMSGASQTTDNTNHVSFYDWNDTSWAASTITATDCLLYDDTITTPSANVAIYIGDFGGSRSTSSGVFQLTLPSNTFNTALVRIA